ncbi:uncharacterized protein J3R85_000078 [Psidium guajava]|nr:uncharacterized protein J3R85_000078 [Psidium guajava]
MGLWLGWARDARCGSSRGRVAASGWLRPGCCYVPATKPRTKEGCRREEVGSTANASHTVEVKFGQWTRARVRLTGGASCEGTGIDGHGAVKGLVGQVHPWQR